MGAGARPNATPMPRITTTAALKRQSRTSAPEGVARVPNEPVDGRGASNLSVRFLSCARCDQVPAFVLARHARRLEPYDSDDEPGFVEAWVDHVRHAENLHLIATEKGAHHPQLGGKTSPGAHRQ